MDYDPRGIKSRAILIQISRLMDEVKLTAAFKSKIKTTTISDLPLIPKHKRNLNTSRWSWVCHWESCWSMCCSENSLNLISRACKSGRGLKRNSFGFGCMKKINSCKNKTTNPFRKHSLLYVCWSCKKAVDGSRCFKLNNKHRPTKANVLDIIRSVLLNINVTCSALFSQCYLCFKHLSDRWSSWIQEHTQINIRSESWCKHKQIVLLYKEALLVKDNLLNGRLLLLSVCNRPYDCSFYLCAAERSVNNQESSGILNYRCQIKISETPSASSVYRRNICCFKARHYMQNYCFFMHWSVWIFWAILLL